MDPTPASEPPATPPAATHDLSQRTIALLVILTLALSFISALVMINYNIMPRAPAQQHTANPSVAEVGFVIASKPERLSDQASGMLALNIEQHK